MEPAGASELALDEAMFAGTDPIVKVNVTDVVEVATVTVLSPESAVGGVNDQLPELFAITPLFWVPIVMSTLPPAVVTPEKVGVLELTQKCLAP